jgi:D-aminoacyl-tRNA deacylase
MMHTFVLSLPGEMRVVVQSVEGAEVLFGSSVVARIGPGLVLYVGIGRGDNKADSITDVLHMKLFDGYTKNVMESRREILVLSQFTLFAGFKGTRPDFHLAGGHERARELFLGAVDLLGKQYSRGMIKNGPFGANIQVKLSSSREIFILELDAHNEGSSAEDNGC